MNDVRCGCVRKKIMNGVRCEYIQKVNENNIGYITIKINDEGNHFLVNPIGTE